MLARSGAAYQRSRPQTGTHLPQERLRGITDSPRLAAAAQRHAHADGEADHGGADDQLATVLPHLATPVGELGNAPPERLNRAPELLALDLDVLAYLLRRAPRCAGG